MSSGRIGTREVLPTPMGRAPSGTRGPPLTPRPRRRHAPRTSFGCLSAREGASPNLDAPCVPQGLQGRSLQVILTLRGRLEEGWFEQADSTLRLKAQGSSPPPPPCKVPAEGHSQPRCHAYQRRRASAAHSSAQRGQWPVQPVRAAEDHAPGEGAGGVHERRRGLRPEETGGVLRPTPAPRGGPLAQPRTVGTHAMRSCHYLNLLAQHSEILQRPESCVRFRLYNTLRATAS